MVTHMTITEFTRTFPDDATCLDYLWRERFSPDGTHAYCAKCDGQRIFKRYPIKNRRTAWSCTACTNHLHPMAGTIFYKSRTPLSVWFYAAYLVSATRGRISAKQLEREIGVTYKCAWRMRSLILDQLALAPSNAVGSVLPKGTET